MPKSYLLFLLFNAFPILLSLAPLYYKAEKQSYGVANKYIDFTGQYKITCRSKTINQVSY